MPQSLLVAQKPPESRFSVVKPKPYNYTPLSLPQRVGRGAHPPLWAAALASWPTRVRRTTGEELSGGPTAPQRDSFKAVRLRKRVFCSMLPNTLLHTLVQNSVVSKRESARMFRLKAIWSNLDGESRLGNIRWIHAMPALRNL